MKKKVTFRRLSVASDYWEFIHFDCNYTGVPEYARKYIDGLATYLYDIDGAKADLKKGSGSPRLHTWTV